MKRVKLIVAYDGTNYHGWQTQPNAVTIEEVLNHHLSELLKEEIKVIGASRTDAGVHALGNVAVFDTSARMPADKISYALNTRLPEDIRIQDSCEVPSDFHPRFQKTTKTYEYRILNRRFPDPTRRLNSFFYYYPLDVVKMQEASLYLVGEHDFKSFCTGTLIRVGGGFIEPQQIKKILEAKDRTLAGETARPEGLTLIGIRYGGNIQGERM